jgi:hypothetical protein
LLKNGCIFGGSGFLLGGLLGSIFDKQGFIIEGNLKSFQQAAYILRKNSVFPFYFPVELYKFLEDQEKVLNK